MIIEIVVKDEFDREVVSFTNPLAAGSEAGSLSNREAAKV